MSTSCTESTEIDYDEVEQVIFDDWMALHRPDLLENYQSEGGYYIDLVSQGDTSLRAIGDTICWVEYNLTGYDLWGNVSITRNDVIAWQQGTYSDYTHYVPYFRYCDADTSPVLECTQMAFINELTIGEQSDVVLYNGAEFTLYAPSSISASGGTTGTGGYDGQYSLSTLPFVCTVEVTNVVYDPLEYEEGLLDSFCTVNGGLTIDPESLEDEDDDDDASTSSTEVEADSDDIFDTAWTNSVSTIGYLYINQSYTPNLSGGSFTYENPYISTVPDSPYVNGVEALDKLINAALDNRFSDDYDDDGEEVGEDGTANVWYICRFLDGFIIDTNIDEVKELIYGSVDSTGTAITYDVETDESSYISGWYYTIPYMNYGKWCSIAMTSTYAYGSDGVNGDTTTTSSSSSYYDYYNYYSSYYSSSYYNYNYYDSSYYYDYDSSTTTSISTEILPYTPLLFEIYVEASDDDDDDE